MSARSPHDEAVVRYLLARTADCPFTDHPLDPDRVAVLRRRSDGEILAVISPEGAAGLSSRTVVRFAARGIEIEGRPAAIDRATLAAGRAT